MRSEIVIVCPTCMQKYRVSGDRLGQHATCKKCGQRFRIQTEEAIDDDTILGWVMEGETADQSILGSTSIFQAPPPPRTTKGESGPRRPTISAWKPKPPPEKRRVRFDRIDDIGAYFEFPTNELRYTDIRRSFPLKCIHCLATENLEVHVIIWGDKLPRQDTFHRKELEAKALGRLDQLLRTHKNRWFDMLEPLTILPPPFCNPFPFFVCHNCSTVGEIMAHVLLHDGEEYCQIGIANLDIAREFFYNNGGKGDPSYRRLVEAGARQRDDKWRRLSFPVRSKISSWFKPKEGERFLGYFADTDFSRAETGTAGVILTDHRMIFKKYSTLREYDMEAGGRIRIEADKRKADIHISQPSTREATLHSTPLAASHLAKALSKLNHPWQVKVNTKSKIK